MRLLDQLRARLWKPRPWERWYVTPRRVPAGGDVCTWCGGHNPDAVIDGEATHLNVRPYCARQRETLRAHGRRA